MKAAAWFNRSRRSPNLEDKQHQVVAEGSSKLRVAGDPWLDFHGACRNVGPTKGERTQAQRKKISKRDLRPDASTLSRPERGAQETSTFRPLDGISPQNRADANGLTTEATPADNSATLTPTVK